MTTHSSKAVGSAPVVEQQGDSWKSMSRQERLMTIASIGDPSIALESTINFIYEKYKDKAIRMTEDFYSFQGEGAASGQPAYFVRTAMCNLRCVWCDSKRTWASKEKSTVGELLERIRATPTKLVVITGGEPVLHQRDEGFIAFLALLRAYGYKLELETSGSLDIVPHFGNLFGQINISPKLSSSEVPYDDKYQTALTAITCNYRDTVYLKYVIANEQDFKEAQAQVGNLALYHPEIVDKVYLMPEGNTKKAQLESMEWVVDLCLKHGYRFCPRVHVLIWDDKEGV